MRHAGSNALCLQSQSLLKPHPGIACPRAEAAFGPWRSSLRRSSVFPSPVCLATFDVLASGSFRATAAVAVAPWYLSARSRELRDCRQLARLLEDQLRNKSHGRRRAEKAAEGTILCRLARGVRRSVHNERKAKLARLGLATFETAMRYSPQVLQVAECVYFDVDSAIHYLIQGNSYA